MSTRRDFIKKATYVAPVVMTLSARPSYAGTGSNRPVSDATNRRRRRRRKRRRRIRDWLRDLLR